MFARLYDFKPGSMKPVQGGHRKVAAFFRGVTNQVAWPTAFNPGIINVCSLDCLLHDIENFNFILFHGTHPALC